MPIEGKPTVAVLAQALNDHLLDCTSSRVANSDRLKRIEGILIAVAGAIILQLLAAVAYLTTHRVQTAPIPATPVATAEQWTPAPDRWAGSTNGTQVERAPSGLTRKRRET